MTRLRSLSLRLTLGLSLALAGGSLVVTGCSKSKPAEAKDQKAKKAPEKPKPTNPWLDGVIKDAEVSVTYTGGKPIRCQWNEKKKRHLCPGQKRWVYVGPEVWRVGKDDAYCIWQHPVPEGVVTTKLKGIAKQPLEVRHAFAGRSYTVKEAAPVDVVVRVDGEVRAKAQRLRKPGFDKLRIERAKEGKPGDLELEVSASHTGVAHFCWQIEALPEGAAAAATTATPEVKAASAAAPEGKAAPASDVKATDAKATDAKADAAKGENQLEAASSTSEASRPTPKLQRSRLNIPEGAALKPAVPLKVRKVPARKEQ